MNHEIYIFGSITRGEVNPNSDTDVLVIPLGDQARQVYPSNWSYYTEETLRKMHKDGRLFSWHLYLDSTCVHTHRETPLLVEMGPPNSYSTALEDIGDLKALLDQSIQCLHDNTPNQIYEIGLIHTCLRDIAMSASWWFYERPCFSIYAPYQIDNPLPLDREIYRKAISARHNSTRGINSGYDWKLVTKEILSAPIRGWVSTIQRGVNELVS